MEIIRQQLIEHILILIKTKKCLVQNKKLLNGILVTNSVGRYNHGDSVTVNHWCYR